jgi:hypothetical protein
MENQILPGEDKPPALAPASWKNFPLQGWGLSPPETLSLERMNFPAASRGEANPIDFTIATSHSL